MATSSDTQTQEASIRRIRSAGDIPRLPERVHVHSGLRISDGTPGPHDVQPTFNDGRQTLSIPPSPLDRLRSSPAESYSIVSPPLIQPGNNVRGPGQPNTLPPPQGTHASRHHERPANVPPAHRHNSFYLRMLTYFGLGRGASHARKALVSFIWTACWDTSQFIIIITMLVLTARVFKSPTHPHLTEWEACERPLGVWASIWLIRLALAFSLAYWEYCRDRILHPHTADPETGNTTVQLTADPPNPRQNNRNGPVNQYGLRNADPVPPPTLPYSAAYSRLTLLSSLLTLSWFLTAHILEYASVNTCRHSSPHLWWLVFGILCILYFMVLEVVLLGLVVLVIAPILFIFWNIFLICIGRHPLQNPNMIKPEIGKLSKSLVERIPLVMYIPSPPEDKKDAVVTPHTYPPKSSPATASNPTHRRFKLFRSPSSFGSKKGEGEDTSPEKEKDTITAQEPIAWEDNWEQTDFPFVALEGNRAACAICLMDFEEPKRKHPLDNQKTDEMETPDNKNEIDTSQGPLAASTSSSSPQRAIIGEEEREGELPRLTDAGDGAQPLRLLECGHVFHKTCLDPWLINVSGRCPVCQRAVEVPKNGKKSRRRT